MKTDNLSSGFKYSRVLEIYTRLMNDEVINKADEAEHFGVSEKSIQRDIDDLRAFFDDRMVKGDVQRDIVYDSTLNGYRLITSEKTPLSDSEILAVCKILLESRAFSKGDMNSIIKKLIKNCVPKSNQSLVESLILNEMHHYIELSHYKNGNNSDLLLNNVLAIGEAVNKKYVMNITYTRQDGVQVKRKVQPVGIMFSEFYFYLTAFIMDIDKEKEFKNKDDIFPTIYRIDRIVDIDVTDEHFDIPYRDRFEEGEFRKRIQFMHGGKLRHIKFLYKGKSVEAVLDRLPTAQILEKTDDGVVISAEVFGDGVDMWIRGQGENVQILTT